MIKRRKIDYDHKAKSKDYKYSNEFELKAVPIDNMPSFLQKNFEKYSEWFDLETE